MASVSARTMGALLLVGSLGFWGCSNESTAPADAVAPADAPESSQESKAAAPAEAGAAAKGGFLNIGQVEAGALSARSPLLADGTPFDTWVLTGQAGQVVTVDLRSQQFDTWLIVRDSSDNVIGENDDFGDGSDSQVTVTLPADGRIEIHANTHQWNPDGGLLAYEVAASAGGEGGGASATRTIAGSLPAAGTIRSALATDQDRMADGSFYQRWELRGDPFSTVSVQMRSDAVDPYLFVTDGSDVPLAQGDDASEEVLIASVTFMMPQSGVVYVHANTTLPGQTGEYALDVKTTPVPPVDFSGPNNPSGKYALVVGVSNYPDPEKNLPFVANDVKRMVDVLKNDLGFPEQNIVVLQDAAANRENIARGFMEHLGKAGPNGIAVFYYSGHGTQLDENVGLQPPLDEEANGVDQALYVFDGVLVDDEIGILLDQLHTPNVLVVFDSCHSGTGTRDLTPAQYVSKSIPFEAIDPKELHPKSVIGSKWTKAAALRASGAGKSYDLEYRGDAQYVFLAAATADQLAWGNSKGVQASYFTYYLTQGLKRFAAEDPKASFSKILDAVGPEVANAVQKRFGEVQTPQAEGSRTSESLDRFLNVSSRR